MDAIDYAILNELKENGRASASEIRSKTLKKIKGVSSSNTIITLITLKEELNF